MREKLRGDQAQASSAKEEAFEDVRLPVDALRFTQRSCKAVFRCGRSLEQTANELANGTLHPLALPKMRVMQRRGLLLSLDNRRLWALKEGQRRSREQDPTSIMYVKVALFVWDPAFDTFLEHLDHGCDVQDGIDIRVRHDKRRRVAPRWVLVATATSVPPVCSVASRVVCSVASRGEGAPAIAVAMDTTRGGAARSRAAQQRCDIAVCRGRVPWY